MSGMGGLIELVLALIILGWGFYELRSVKRDGKAAEEEARRKSAGDRDPA